MNNFWVLVVTGALLLGILPSTHSVPMCDEADAVSCLDQLDCPQHTVCVKADGEPEPGQGPLGKCCPLPKGRIAKRGWWWRRRRG